MNILEMSTEEIVTKFIVERGLDPTDEKIRKRYSPDLIKRFKSGDVSALVEIMRIGVHYSSPLVNRFER